MQYSCRQVVRDSVNGNLQLYSDTDERRSGAVFTQIGRKGTYHGNLLTFTHRLREKWCSIRADR